MRQGTTFIDLLVSMAIIAMLFVGIYVVYFSLIMSVNNIELRDAAVAVVNQELETIRNMPYEDVGTVGGVPPGVIPQAQTVTFGQYSFYVKTTVRNIDDPYDGTLGGNPGDTAPADYKSVAILASCPQCKTFVPLSMTTTIAPRGLESASKNGSLFIYAIDANGAGMPDALVHVVNTNVAPSINLTDTTNASGVLQLVDVSTSTNNYHIVATKAGYSVDQTYPPGAVSNPNPVKPDATVAEQTITSVTLAIDKVSMANVYTSDAFCAAIPGEPFTIQGSKLIGTNPNVLKFSTSSVTSASGTATLANIEWDTYTLALNDARYDVAGTIPANPVIVNPNSTLNFRFVLVPAEEPSLLVAVSDAGTGAGLQDAAATLSAAGFSQMLTSGHTWLAQTDWSGGNYSSQDGGIDANSAPGKITLLANASSSYSTTTVSWLISNTLDFGGASTTLYSLAWNPASEPVQTGAGSLKFQLAANNDNLTWNFSGPDGTQNSYFTATGSVPSAFFGNRYLRYKVFMSTADSGYTPELDDVSVEFNSVCVPPAQVLFQNLAQGTYTLDVVRSDYEEATTSVTVGAGFQSASVPMIHI